MKRPKIMAEKIKFISWHDQSEVYLTSAAVKAGARRSDAPAESEPFLVHRALKPLLGGKGLRFCAPR